MNAHTYNPYNEHPCYVADWTRKDGWKDEITYLAQRENEQDRKRKAFNGRRLYPSCPKGLTDLLVP